MDKDKSQIQFLGQPLLARIVERFSSLAEEIIITTNDPQKLSYLGLSLYKDILLGNGALGGLYTALYYASHPYVAVVACDMPFASPSLVAAAMLYIEEQHACQR
jgi:molybdopterin-guanine dinucleotide biosynthesis protein A